MYMCMNECRCTKMKLTFAFIFMHVPSSLCCCARFRLTTYTCPAWWMRCRNRVCITSSLGLDWSLCMYAYSTRPFNGQSLPDSNSASNVLNLEQRTKKLIYTDTCLNYFTLRSKFMSHYHLFYLGRKKIITLISCLYPPFYGIYKYVCVCMCSCSNIFLFFFFLDTRILSFPFFLPSNFPILLFLLPLVSCLSFSALQVLAKREREREREREHSSEEHYYFSTRERRERGRKEKKYTV